MSNKNHNTSATAQNSASSQGAVHQIIPERTRPALVATSFCETALKLREDNAHEDFIKHLYASELQTMIEPADYGEFNSLVNKRLGLHYSVAELKAYDINTPVLKDTGLATPIQIQRRSIEELEGRVKNGETLTPEEMTVLNLNKAAVQGYDQALENGKTPEEAQEESNKVIANRLQETFNDLVEESKGWMQPKFISAASALLAASFNIVSNSKYNVGAIAGGVTGAAAAYLSADYLFTQFDAVRKLPEWAKVAGSAATGTALGLGGVMLGEFVQGRFFPNDVVEDAIDAVETAVGQASNANAIPAPTAELAAYL